MSFFYWSDDLNVNIKTIDEQHQKLVDLINCLHLEMGKPNQDRLVIEELLEELINESYNHFISEENLFIQYQYPDAKSHLAEHDAFSSIIVELLQKFEAGQAVSIETLDFLTEWLHHHLKIVDQKYGAFLRAQGAA